MLLGRSLQDMYSIYACGSNGQHQLGLGHDHDCDSLQPVNLPLAGKPVQFAFGGNHTLILDLAGQVFASGNNEFGQCGIEEPATLRNFAKVPGTFSCIAAGWDYSVLVSTDGGIYTCGHGPNGELGLGPEPTVAGLSRVNLPITESVQTVVSSLNHIVVQMDSGRFVGWGACRHGQLGSQEPVILPQTGRLRPRQAISTPQILDFPPSKNVHVARNRTVLVAGQITVHGAGAQVVPVTANKVACMWSSVHFTASSARPEFGAGPVYSFGNDLHGQLFRYRLPAPLKDFACGSEHGLALLDDNTVWAWGWGEHGNCGKDDTSISMLYEGSQTFESERVVMVKGGQATSWVVTERSD